jgi:hypothetical protein
MTTEFAGKMPEQIYDQVWNPNVVKYNKAAVS